MAATDRRCASRALIDLLVPGRGGSVAVVATYEYRCRACGTTFEERRPMAEADARDLSRRPLGHHAVALGVRDARPVGRDGSQPGPASGGGCCGGACGCG